MLREERARMAAAIYADRRDRDDLFGAYHDGLGEPAWDMLLLLYVRDAESVMVTAGELIEAAGHERLRGLTWPYLGYLKSHGLVALDGLGEDGDDVVTLLDRGRALMDAYLDRRDVGGAAGRAH